MQKKSSGMAKDAFHSSGLRRHGEWAYFGPGLGICKRPEFRSNTAGDRGRLAGGLEAAEVGPVAPGEGTAQPHARLHGRVVDDIDRALVVGRARSEAREVAEVSARRKERGHAWDLGDLV